MPATVRSAGSYHGPVCMDDSPAGLSAMVRHEVEPAIEIDLEPVDSVVVTTLIDNVTDALMTDQGPARRFAFGSGPSRPSALMEAAQVPDALIAEHGFSVLVTVTKAGQEHRFLFDAGTSPDGVVENMRRLDIDPSSIEAIVCSHGHFDHTTGLDGLIRVLGQVNMPVLIHPHFWRRRRLQLPGREPRELPTTSRRALIEAGFEIIEERQPSFLFGRSVLITGEVATVHRLRARVPAAAGLARRALAARPARARRPGAHRQRQGQGPGGDHRLRSRGRGQHRRYARRLTGGQPLYALLGGFHLGGPLFEPLIPRVLDDLAALNPGVLVPAHCTGWRAQHAMAARFPEAYIPSTVGTSFLL